MAIQSSVLVLASLLFAAHALGGLRAKGGLNQNISVEANVEYHHCPNNRFPCYGRCEVMHRRCQKELDGCDAETPNRQHCPLTKCLSKCGCGKSPGSHAMTCHQHCIAGKPSRAETGLMDCVVKNTRWMQEVMVANKLLGAVAPNSGRRRFHCPNQRFPCQGRCNVMHGRCQKQLDGCDAETPNRKHCPLTACLSKCGCAKNPGSKAMTCNQHCIAGKPSKAENALMDCVVKNTKWMQEVMVANKLLGQVAPSGGNGRGRSI